MRKKQDAQGRLDFQGSNLKLTNEYYAKYEAISAALDETPRLLNMVHKDLEAALKDENRESRKRGGFVYTSEMVLRLALCQTLECCSLRGIVVRVDDSLYLRRFTRIHEGPMMGHTTLCRLRNAIQPETWKSMNGSLAKAAVESGRITGEKLRMDTTAVETNIHWPSDSSLLWDCYRTLARLIEKTREIDRDAVGPGRIHLKRTKKLATVIARKARHKGKKAKDLKTIYERLISSIEGICGRSTQIAERLEGGEGLCCSPELVEYRRILVEQFGHFVPLTRRVVWQASERVIHGRQVPNEKKLFSIFEEHTELLKRGKAGKDIEFGHMIQIQQTGEKFITDYGVFDEKPVEPKQILPALNSHKNLFGHYPESIAADKGYWSGDEFAKIPDKVKVVSIPKKGSRNKVEREREHDPLFRLAQAFRAGVEGSISFLKRILGLGRCMNKGWQRYSSTVGATILAHNLLVLTRC